MALLWVLLAVIAVVSLGVMLWLLIVMRDRAVQTIEHDKDVGEKLERLAVMSRSLDTTSDRLRRTISDIEVTRWILDEEAASYGRRGRA